MSTKIFVFLRGCACPGGEGGRGLGQRSLFRHRGSRRQGGIMHEGLRRCQRRSSYFCVGVRVRGGKGVVGWGRGRCFAIGVLVVRAALCTKGFVDVNEDLRISAWVCVSGAERVSRV